MPYVPGLNHDLFISYAHEDDAQWIATFCSRLTEELTRDLGSSFTLWRDDKNLRFGTSWPDEIQLALRGTAALMALCSPSYYRSEWCSTEFETFLAANGATQADLSKLEVENICRFLKVLVSNNAENLHAAFHPNLQYETFFSEENGIAVRPGSEPFETRLFKVRRVVAGLLRSMRRNKQPIFIGDCATDVRADWNALAVELKKIGFDVRPESALHRGLDIARLGEQLIGDKSQLAVFILGAKYDRFVHDIIELVLARRLRAMYWVQPRAGTMDSAQATLLDLIRAEGWEALGGHSIRDAIAEIEAATNPRVEAAAPLPRTSPEIFLVYDRTTPADDHASGELARVAAVRQMRVRRSDSDAIVRDHLQFRERFLQGFDGVLLFHDRAPHRWIREHLIELAKAETVERCCVLSQPDLASHLRERSDLRIVAPADPLPVAALQPFFEAVEKRWSLGASDSR